MVATLGIILYILACASYTIAVFTDPGSPLNSSSSSNSAYSTLPTHESDQSQVTPGFTSLTAKSTGKARYCKKCNCLKPDRSHHCSTCGRCVLKMDHHCPWLATCVGLRNYKAFILFLVYTSVFCWVCFLESAQWVWTEIVDNTMMEESAMVVNTILLAVLAGIIGLVLSGFTGWHIYLVINGTTTIESLEKTRYLSPVKKSMERQMQKDRGHGGPEDEDGNEQSQPLMDQLKEIHANALPGVTRPEEGEEADGDGDGDGFDSPARSSLRQNYADLEEQRERDRYQDYLDEQDSEKLPHAFDLGWKRNLTNVFGAKKLLWPLPVCNTSGDGWRWEVSEEWITQRDEAASQRVQKQEAIAQRWRDAPSNGFAVQNMHAPPRGAGKHYAQGPPRSMQRTNGTQGVAMQDLDTRKQQQGMDEDEYDTSSDEDSRRGGGTSQVRPGESGNWNDIPDDFLSSGGGRQSRSRQKGD